MDFPLYEWQLAHGAKPAVPESYRPGLRTRWLLGDIRRLQSLVAEPDTDGFPRPSFAHELFSLIKDFLPTTRPMVWSFSDPLPALLQLRAGMKELGKALLCRFTRFEEYRQLGWPNSKWVFRQRVFHFVGSRRCSPPKDLSGVRAILFVCHGNRIRSPMAAALLRRYLAYSRYGCDIEVLSGGLIEHLQEQVDERAIAAAEEMGIRLSAHRPTRVTAEVIERADIIFLMDRLNEVRMLTVHPQAKDKMLLLGSLGSGRNGRRPVEIRDPGNGSLDHIRRCYLQLDNEVRKLSEMLLRSKYGSAFSEQASDTRESC
jgi:protein-tyrosine-phosphatase